MRLAHQRDRQNSENSDAKNIKSGKIGHTPDAIKHLLDLQNPINSFFGGGGD